MTCSSCKFLKENDRCDGALCGAKYYCSKHKTYVNGANNLCDGYEKTYSRNNYECDEIFEDGLKFSDDNKPISFYIIILFLVIVLGLLLTLLQKLGAF